MTDINDNNERRVSGYGSCEDRFGLNLPPNQSSTDRLYEQRESIPCKHFNVYALIGCVLFFAAIVGYQSGNIYLSANNSVKEVAAVDDSYRVEPPHNIVPTLLSIFEPAHDGYHMLNAHNNPLYTKLQKCLCHENHKVDEITTVHSPIPSPTCSPTISRAPAKLAEPSPISSEPVSSPQTLSPALLPAPFYHKKSKNHEAETEKEKLKQNIKLLVDHASVHFHERLIVRWVEESSKFKVYEDDVIALYCPADERDSKKFREAATIGQIEITNQVILSLNSSFIITQNEKENQWLIPSFPIIREDTCEFRLWRLPCGNNTVDQPEKVKEYSSTINMTFPPQLLSRSGPFEIINARSTPTAIHLALTEHPDEILVQFTTGFMKGYTPVVRYIKKKHLMYRHGSPDLKVMKEIQGESSTYKASDLCDAPANISEAGKFADPGMLHKVKLQHLKMDTDYVYMVGIKPPSRHHGGDIVWSALYSFRSAPPIGDTNPFRIIVYGDQGCPLGGWSTGSIRTEKLLEREIIQSDIEVRAIHHIGMGNFCLSGSRSNFLFNSLLLSGRYFTPKSSGDLSYATGAAHVWDEWLEMIQPVASRVPYMIAVGNHEYDYMTEGTGRDPSGAHGVPGFHPQWGDYGNDSGGECGVPTAARFTMPSNSKHRRKSSSNGVFWYSYDMSNVHIVTISTEHDLSKGSDQHNWLKEDLSLVNRKVTPWIILEGHRPLYESQLMPSELEPYGKVSLVERGLRDEFESLLYQYDVDLVLSGHYHSYLRTCKGLYQNVCDNGGPLYITVGTAGAPLLNTGLYPPYLNYTEKHIISWGYGRITIAGSRALLFEFVEDSEGEVKDSVWLVK